MAKTFTQITENGPLVVAGGRKTTLVNSSPDPIFLTSDEIDTALSGLDYQSQQAVLKSLYSLAPGASKSMATGTWNLTFASSVSKSAVLLVEIDS